MTQTLSLSLDVSFHSVNQMKMPFLQKTADHVTGEGGVGGAIDIGPAIWVMGLPAELLAETSLAEMLRKSGSFQREDLYRFLAGFARVIPAAAKFQGKLQKKEMR